MKKPAPLQLKIVQCLVNGTVKQADVAKELNISYRTVRNQLEIARKRTGAGNTSGLVSICMTKGWVEYEYLG